MTAATPRDLAETLAAAGYLPDPRLREAFAHVPRHLFVPRFYRKNRTLVDGSDHQHADEWLDSVYSDQTLTTQVMLIPGTDQALPTSSSTRPALMAHMLQLLELDDGLRVLEIGTGTGYNAALLCHRLGDYLVTSVDIDPSLIARAREALASLGYQPRLTVGDGSKGVAAYAPYDRILATAAIACVPPAWIEQLAPHGRIVADLRGDLVSTLTVLDKVDPDTVQGRFLTTPGHFMWMRAAAANPLRDPAGTPSTIDRDGASHSVTDFDIRELALDDLRFLIQHLHGVDQIWTGHRAGVELTHLHSPDGSWAELSAGSDSRFQVTEGGPRRLWNCTEQTAIRWHELGRPGPERFGLTASRGGAQRLWLDEPDSPHSWPLPAS